MIPANKLEMIRMISEEVGKPRKMVEFVIRDFEANLSKVLRDPVSYTKYVLLEYFGRFKLKNLKVEKKYYWAKQWRPNSEEFRFYNNLMRKYYEGQTEDANDDVGRGNSEVSG